MADHCINGRVDQRPRLLDDMWLRERAVMFVRVKIYSYGIKYALANHCTFFPPVSERSDMLRLSVNPVQDGCTCLVTNCVQVPATA